MKSEAKVYFFGAGRVVYNSDFKWSQKFEVKSKYLSCQQNFNLDGAMYFHQLFYEDGVNFDKWNSQWIFAVTMKFVSLFVAAITIQILFSNY